MHILAMIAASALQCPAILLKQANQLPDFHSRRAALAASGISDYGTSLGGPAAGGVSGAACREVRADAWRRAAGLPYPSVPGGPVTAYIHSRKRLTSVAMRARAWVSGRLMGRAG